MPARGVLALGLLLAACAAPPDGPDAYACPAPGEWLEPASGARPSHQALLAALSARPIVLLGETHDRADHHRWQLQVLAGLYAREPDLVIGFEAFPRAAQPVLDRWTAGALDEAAFLEESRWDEVWGFDPELYLPLLHFARMNRVPLVALNVDRSLVRRVGEAGWQAVPPEEREGVGTPRPAAETYLTRLAETYRRHQEAPEAAPPERNDPDFRAFVAAQLVWDRAMAEALAAAREAPDPPLVVGIIGQGHLEFGHGVPWQLVDLGQADAAVLLPYETAADCAAPPAGLADALFTVAAADPAPSRPRLGIRIVAEDGGGLRVVEVAPGSLAEAAGLAVGDVILAAAGTPLSSPRELSAALAHTAPGRWLPLTLRRGTETLEVVAKIPAGP